MKPLSLSALAILGAVSRSVHSGFDIMDATDLPSGTVYPTLGRLERDGYVRSKWESHAVAQREKRPPRRYYEITAAGSRALSASVEHYRTLGGRLGLTARKPSAGWTTGRTNGSASCGTVSHCSTDPTPSTAPGPTG